MLKYISIGILFFLFACDANKQERMLPTVNKKLNWLLTGLPDDHTIENIVAKFYGFQFVDLGGYVVSKKLRDNISLKNEQVNTLLSTQFGKNWRVDFDDV